MLVVGTMSATAWSAFGMRCRCCGAPVYLYWLLSLDGAKGRSFRNIDRCPYCEDDGSGETGNPGNADASAERRRAIRSALTLLAAFLLVVATIFLVSFLAPQ